MASPSYEVVVTPSFEKDLDAAVRYYLEQSGPISAGRLMDEFDSFRRLVAALPGHGSRVGDSGLRWRRLGVFVAVYGVDDDERVVTLLRLYYVSSDWRRRVLGEA
jgi:plasmid stabilization system protein ParE